MEPSVLATEDLPWAEAGSRSLDGGHHRGVRVSVFVVHAAPGQGPRLHRRPYVEVFVVLRGMRLSRWAGTPHVSGGTIVIGPAGVPHEFVNCGDKPLDMVTIHPRAEMIGGQWLEEETIAATGTHGKGDDG